MEFGEAANKNGPCLDTVRALHQTVVSLRAALEQSRTEILELKQRAWPLESVENALKALSIENQVLRNNIIEKDSPRSKEGQESNPLQDENDKNITNEARTVKDSAKVDENEGKKCDKPVCIAGETQIKKKIVFSSPEAKKPPKKHVKIVTPPQTFSPPPYADELKQQGPESTVKLEKQSPTNTNKNFITTQPSVVSSSTTGSTENISIVTENLSPRKISRSLESLTIFKPSLKTSTPKTKLSISKTVSFSNILQFETPFKIVSPHGTSSEGLKTLTDTDISVILGEVSNLNMTDDNGRQSSVRPSGKCQQFSSSGDTVHSQKSSAFHSHAENSSPDSFKFCSSSQSTSQRITSQSSSVSVLPNTSSTFQSNITFDNNESEEGSLQKSESQNDLEEVDDIELIFTTEETKDTDFKGELVPIEAGDTQNDSDQFLQCPTSDFDQNLSAETSDRELDDDVFNDNVPGDVPMMNKGYEMERENSHLYNSKSDNSINQEKSLKSYYSYQDSSFENKSLEKDESFDRFEERVRIIETDISKCGIIDIEYTAGRRNTCPNPLPYRPIIHREAIGKGLNTRKGRPILSHSNNARRDSGAQTDISALPNSAWRSESSLAHKVKVGENFTTLPSKFPLPGSRLRLSEKTNIEARRVLLSDIGFTSMVPELSRSADHLFPGSLKTPIPTNYGQFLRTPDLYSPGYTSQRFMWAATASPTELSQSHSRYSSLYPLSSPPVSTRRCSAPVSPSRRVLLKHTPSKVRFANGSLPELRSNWTSLGDSGDSTDSLVEEAEHYLRRSIDCIVTGREVVYHSDGKSHGPRRASAPEPSRDNVPPQDWQPFLPRTPRDLHPDHWIKVIVPEGKVRGGRVRYIGPVLNQMEQYVGVQLSSPDGHCDGSYNNRRYFYCEPHHGIFVPFKKVVMGWRP